MRLVHLVGIAVAAAAGSPACNGGGGDADVSDGTGTDSPDAPDVPDAPDHSDAPDADDEAEDDAAPPCMTEDASCMPAGGCHEPPYALTCIGGRVETEVGAPVADRGVAVCAGTRCFSGRTDSNGWFALRVPVATLDNFGIYFPGAEPLIPPYCRFTELCDGPIHLCNRFVLYPAPAAGTAVPFEALAADIRVEGDDGAVIVLPAGAEVMLPLGDEPRVAITRFPLDEHVPCFIDPAAPPVALWVVTPSDSFVIEPGTSPAPVLVPADLDLPNDTGLPPGTEVDVLVVGSPHALAVGLEEGEWRAVTTATVTPDGNRIRTAPGEGIGFLTWFGIRPR